MRSQFDNLIQVYTETGRKHTFAGVLDWPGWCRMGQDEQAALEALFAVTPRYAAVLHAAGIEFQPPADPAELIVVERLEGNATTDFGAPNIPPSNDARKIGEAEFSRLQGLVMACWQAFDAAVIAGSGRELRKGPRGGGRDLDGIFGHLARSDASDLSRLAWKFKLHDPENPLDELGAIRQATLNALARAAFGELPERGPRDASLWTPRHYIRRLAWHTLDHAWEIEDRII